jgi:hypothetical protein
MFFFPAPDDTHNRLIGIVIKLTLLICIGTGLARGEENLEYKIKTAYLYNFTKFITWPKSSTPTFNICLIGEDPFQNLLDSLESKTAQDKPIRVFRYNHSKQIKDCQIIYFSNTDPHLDQAMPNALVVGNLNNSLSVSSQPFFAESGGMIGFVLEQEKVKLHINLKALRKNGLEISAKLIEVATLVGGDEHE